MIKIETEVWCRTCGYFRPVKQMHPGKREEFMERLNYKLPEGLNDRMDIITSSVNN